MAEEDIIFGKNLHLYGGIEPSNMKTFSAALSSNGKIALTAQLPTDTVIDGQTLCTVAGAVIRKKSTGYPTNEFDGEKVMDITYSGTFIDEASSPKGTFYYAAFPYTTQGVYNRSSANRTSFVGATYYYGYDLDTTDSDPTTRVTYPSGVDNYGFDPAYMDTSNDTFKYGGWQISPGDKFMPRPCMLTYAGTVENYLDPNDYSKNADGTTSTVSSSTTANAMMEWPKIYTHREEVGGVYKFRCADRPFDDTWDCWCNYDKNDNQIDHFYTSIYMGASTSGTSNTMMKSLSGKSNKGNLSYDTYFDKCTAIGDSWTPEVLADRLLIQDLLVMMAKTTNCQTAYGAGYKTLENQTLISGTMNAKGMFYSSSTTGVKVFGMEHWWGNFIREIAGWMKIDSKHYIKITRGTHDGSNGAEYADAQNTYSRHIAVSGATSRGYISKMTTFPYGRIPLEVNGSSTTYETDYFEWRSGTCVAWVGCEGGSASAGDGPFYANLSNAPSVTEAVAGVALSCKPIAS